MTNFQLTQDEANRLINMLKRAYDKYILFPGQGKSCEFDVIGDSNRDIFTIKICHGKRDRLKYTFNARIKKNGQPLLELHITSKNAVHQNPDGTKLYGSHFHIYTEEHGRRFAFTVDIKNEDFVENTITFLDKFNVIEKPTINLQYEII